MSDVLMDMLEHPEDLLKQLLEDLTTCQKNAKSFGMLDELLTRGAAVSGDKMQVAVARSLHHLNSTVAKLAAVGIIYASSNTFNSDVGSVLVKLGRGQEALQAMFKRKMG